MRARLLSSRVTMKPGMSVCMLYNPCYHTVTNKGKLFPSLLNTAENNIERIYQIPQLCETFVSALSHSFITYKLCQNSSQYYEFYVI